MTAVPSPPAAPVGDSGVPSAVRTYERLLVLYPKPFRDQYGPDLVQLFGDLMVRMGHDSPRRVWRRVLPDLAVSATKQRLASIAAPGGRRPSPRAVVVLVLVVGVSVVVGNPLLFPIGVAVVAPFVALVLFGLPAIGVVLLRRAWVAWRTVGARPVVRTLLGVALFVPGVWWLIAKDAGYWTLVVVVLGLIYGLGLGAIMAIATLVRARHEPQPPRRKWRAIAMITVAVLVLGGMAAAGFNSYLNSRPPPGDHSPNNASVESRRLWDAAYEGDVDTVLAMIDACADPFVHFDDGGRARSNAEHWAGVNHSGRDPVPEPFLGRYLTIIDALHEAEDTWTARCNS